MNERVAGLVGIARRGNRLALGFDACRRAVAEQKAALIILAEDLSPASATRLRHRVHASSIRVIVHGGKSEWGRLLGREQVGIIAVLDVGLAKAILQKL